MDFCGFMTGTTHSHKLRASARSYVHTYMRARNCTYVHGKSKFFQARPLQKLQPQFTAKARSIMTTTSNHVTSAAKTGKILTLDEYKNLTGDRQLQQMIQSAVTSALGQMHLDNPIPDHSNTEKSAMSTIDAKMKRCCISTEFGNIWVQGKTIPKLS